MFAGIDPPPPPRPQRFRSGHWLAIAVAMAVYAAYIIPMWTHAYIDFGDGNYMYIAKRIAEGGVVYRDILAPQPPMHLFTGAGLVLFSDYLELDSSLIIFRIFSLLLRLACFGLLVRLAWLAWGRATEAVVAGILYLVMPLGIWWSMAYQSEPLEIFFLLAMMNFAVRPSRANDIATGIFGGLAALTNATAAPFLLVLIVYMLVRNWRRALQIAVPALVMAAVAIVAMWIYTGEFWAFINNAVLNQVGTYPEDVIGYALGKILSEGTDILYRESLFIIFGVIGFFRYLRRSPLPEESRDGLAWFCLATMASFLYVSKGGTMDYIFTLGEPAVALLAGGEVTALARQIRGRRGEEAVAAAPVEAEAIGIAGLDAESDDDASHGAVRGSASELVLKVVGLAALALVFGFFLRPTVSFYFSLWNQTAFELPTLDAATELASERAEDPEDVASLPNVDQIVYWIERYSDPDEPILAPPFYAYIADRRIWGDFSEIYIWTIKDYNDRQEGEWEGEGWRKTREMAAALRRQEIPIAIIELDQTGRKPEVIEALQHFYRPVVPEPYQTLNTRLLVMVPREDVPPAEDGELPREGQAIEPQEDQIAPAGDEPAGELQEEQD